MTIKLKALLTRIVGAILLWPMISLVMMLPALQGMLNLKLVEAKSL